MHINVSLRKFAAAAFHRRLFLDNLFSDFFIFGYISHLGKSLFHTCSCKQHAWYFYNLLADIKRQFKSLHSFLEICQSYLCFTDLKRVLSSMKPVLKTHKTALMLVRNFCNKTNCCSNGRTNETTYQIKHNQRIVPR